METICLGKTGFVKRLIKLAINRYSYSTKSKSYRSVHHEFGVCPSTRWAGSEPTDDCDSDSFSLSDSGSDSRGTV